MPCISIPNTLLSSFHETPPHILSVGCYRSCGHRIKRRPTRALYARDQQMKQTFLLLAQLPAPNTHAHTGIQTHTYSHAHTNTHMETHMCAYTHAPKHAKQELLATWHQNKAPESGWKSRGHILKTFLVVLELITTCLTSTWTGWLCLYSMVPATKGGLQGF